ncbi:hypothetical protein Sjap_017891 [Stephania japonica]|uniref:Histone-binding protein RBBP4-like N-terminal domain-containing protein n=1 Tax=Stephania japonica TaxID=461633 RepID=A0AAP0I7J9_9MAGN
MARSLKNPKKRKNKGSKKGGGASSSSSSSSSSSIPSLPTKVWQPGVDKLEEGEELQCDPSAYNSLHAFHIGWPCLSFDILRDQLGLIRTGFPQTVYCIAGTQAEKAPWNYIGVFKLSKISGKRRDLVPKRHVDGGDGDDDMDSESSSDDEEEGGEGESQPPVLQLHKVAHEGGVNRIRAMAQNPHICASWADTGHVQIWDLSADLNALAESEAEVSTGGSTLLSRAPLIKFGGHKDEGYALDWSPLVSGRLLSGDCKNCINLWEPSSSATWNVDPCPFIGHTASVEDLQWSPTELDVFASALLMALLQFGMLEEGNHLLLLASCMIASGSDDGAFSIHDLRQIQSTRVDAIQHGSGHGIRVDMSNLSSYAADLRNGRERDTHLGRGKESSRFEKRKKDSCRSKNRKRELQI